MTVPYGERESQPAAAPDAGSATPPDVRKSPVPTSLSQAGRAGQVLSWKDVSVTANAGKEEEKKILKSVSGIAKTGELIAVMGPSGAGKTCLLNALAGRSPGVTIDGAVQLNGIETSAGERRSRSGYVMQEDALLTTQTPREVLEFGSILRLGLSDAAERAALVDSVLEALGLEACADTPIGTTLDTSEKGRVSGGEKKRVAIAQELLPRPGVMFLDEPTSGLDSFNALRLVQVLKSLAEDGCAVMCTIHQPSSEVIAKFDRVMLLANGGLVYDGPVREVPAFFASHGILMPPRSNPADFAMLQLQELSAEKLVSIREVRTDVTPPPPGDSLPPKSERRGTFCDALRLLTKRDLNAKFRDKTTLVARFGILIILAVLSGLMFLRVGDDWGEDGNPNDIHARINDHFGILFFYSINTLLTNSGPPLLAFVPERPVFVREFASGTYGVVPYVLSKVLIEVPTVMLTTAVGLGIATGLMGLQGNYGLFWLSYVLFSLAASSASFCVGAVAPSAETAFNLLPLAMVPQILLGGFIVANDTMPEWIAWLQYVCPLKYAVNLALLIEFDDSVVPDNRELEIDALLDRTNVNSDSTETFVFYLGVLVAITVVLRVIATVALHFKGKSAFASV